MPGQSLAEVDRYIARPGQALAYKLGELKIKELRRKAEQALGARFDIRDFHDVVLRNGTLPLDLLEEQVNAYIAGREIESGLSGSVARNGHKGWISVYPARVSAGLALS